MLNLEKEKCKKINKKLQRILVFFLLSFFRKKEVTLTVLTQNFISSFNQKKSSSAFTSLLMLGSEWSEGR